MATEWIRRDRSRHALALVTFITGSLATACSRGDEQNAIRSLPGSANDSAVFRDGNASPEGQRVALTEAAYRTAEIRTEPVRAERGSTESPGLEVPGQIEFDPRRVALISPRTPGRIERLLVVEGDRVRAGQPVALLFSPAFIAAQQEFLQAARRARALTGSSDSEGAEAVVRAARQRLTLLGVQDSSIATLERGGEPLADLVVTAPLAGSVLESHALQGSMVEIGTPLFKVADLSEVDAVAAVPERALPLVHIGQSAWVSIAAFPGMEFAGHVERLRDELDPETRTVRAAIHVPNSAGRLRPGMFASVRLAVRLGLAAAGDTARRTAASMVLTIPESAVLTDAEGRFVFVEVAPRVFERRRVEVAPVAPPGSTATPGGRVVVRAGLRGGEQVVVNGAFTLKSELAKARLGEDEH